MYFLSNVINIFSTMLTVTFSLLLIKKSCWLLFFNIDMIYEIFISSESVLVLLCHCNFLLCHCNILLCLKSASTVAVTQRED